MFVSVYFHVIFTMNPIIYSKYFINANIERFSLFSSLFQLQTHEIVEVCAKILYQVELNRGNLDIMWGFSVEAELVENSEKQDELCCYVSRVEERSVAMTNGELKLKLIHS